MSAILKFTIYLIFSGIFWFLIFSVPLGKNGSVFLKIQALIKVTPEAREKESLKNEINREKVIDALSKAFEEEKP